ncbi:MAG: ArgE/DapE family deacylase [Actinomycetia bacterium]|nr:ArgE/DapE family deacylase [Actinomycetes bacterium]
MTLSSLTGAERAALDAVDALGPSTWTAMLADLIAIPSVTGSAAEAEAQRWVADRLEALGCDVDHWQVDLTTLTADPEFPGMEAPREEAWGTVGVLGGSGAAGEVPFVAFQGHTDVVPPGDLGQWAGDPFAARAAGDVMFGRGACDMKAGVVANLIAVEALVRSGVQLPGPIAVHAVGGEEDGGLGAFATLRRGHTARACVITEPTSETAIIATGGALTFTLTVAGAATHGSTRYEGVSALDVFVPVYQALQDLERERNAEVSPLMAEYPIAYPLMVGRVDAGDWSSTVPDRLTAEGRYGVQLGEDVALARAAFEERVAEASAADPWLRDHPVRVAWSGGQFASGRYAGAGDDGAADDHWLLPTLQDAVADVTGGVRPRRRGAPYGSDLRLYNGAGIPSIHYGPGEARHAHSTIEQVRLPEIGVTARALVLTALRAPTA